MHIAGAARTRKCTGEVSPHKPAAPPSAARLVYLQRAVEPAALVPESIVVQDVVHLIPQPIA